MKILDLFESNRNIIDNVNGWGAVPNNQEVDYLGLRVSMTPKIFIDLAAPLGQEPSNEIQQHLKQGGTIGAPFLIIEIPESWKDGDFDMPARVVGHEGRNRMIAIEQVFGNRAIETHLFFSQGLRNRHITDDFKKHLNKILIKEKSKTLISGPFFSLNKTESTQQTEAFDTDVEWILGFDHDNKKIFATKVDGAYIELTYNLLSNGDLYISFSRSGKMSVTGEGKQNKIFGAVINHIKSYAAQTNPKRLVFSAFKPATGPFGSQDTTRSSLYKRMVQRFASQNGYNFEVQDSGNEDTFILTRQESKNTEERYTAREWAIISGGHSLEESKPKHKLFDFGKY